MKPIFKRLLSGVLSTIMAISAVPIVSANSEESAESYPYTLFAASKDDGAITVNAGNFCVNGNVATNGTIVSSSNMNINGIRNISSTCTKCWNNIYNFICTYSHNNKPP